jgi:hypothetical protein
LSRKLSGQFGRRLKAPIPTHVFVCGNVPRRPTCLPLGIPCHLSRRNLDCPVGQLRFSCAE